MGRIGLAYFALAVFCWCCSRAPSEAVTQALGNTTLWEEVSIQPKETLSQLVETHEIWNVRDFLLSAKQAGKTRLRLGEKVRFHRTLGPISKLVAVEFPTDARRSLFLRWKQGAWNSDEVVRTFTERERKFSGIVSTTLWASATDAKMDIQLLIRLSEVFAWAVDFSREIKKDDEWRLVATEFLDGDKHVGWKDIQVAELMHGTQVLQAFNYTDEETKRSGFFTELGESLEKIFLKSPIKFARISSKFSRKRFHPILGVNRPHLGVDYAASTGTPVMAVGDGVVTFAARSGGGGRVVKLRHNDTFSTAYKHLSRFAPGVRPGKRVHQGEVIAFVGTTGLSTGPHLHFEFLKYGSFVDPQGLKFPAAVPLKLAEQARFQSTVKVLAQKLPEWSGPTSVILRGLSSTK